jgi:hypothetical protein
MRLVAAAVDAATPAIIAARPFAGFDILVFRNDGAGDQNDHNRDDDHHANPKINWRNARCLKKSLHSKNPFLIVCENARA